MTQITQIFFLLPCGWGQLTTEYTEYHRVFLLPCGMENGIPNYVFPRSFASLWMTKGNLNKNSVELRVLCGEKVKKNPRYLRYPQMKNIASNYVLPRSFLPSVVWMTKGEGWKKYKICGHPSHLRHLRAI